MIQLKKLNATQFGISAQPYAKDSVTVIYLPDGESITLMFNGVAFYENQPYNIFADGDNANTFFSSLTELKKYIDRVFYAVSPFALPFRRVSTADTNDELIKAGETIISSLLVTNNSTSDRFLKLYDKDSAPTGGDVPMLTFTLPAPKNVDAGGETTLPAQQVQLIPEPIKFYYGIGIRITGGISDGDATAIGAGEVVVNMIYR